MERTQVSYSFGDQSLRPETYVFFHFKTHNSSCAQTRDCNGKQNNAEECVKIV